MNDTDLTLLADYEQGCYRVSSESTNNRKPSPNIIDSNFAKYCIYIIFNILCVIKMYIIFNYIMNFHFLSKEN